MRAVFTRRHVLVGASTLAGMLALFVAAGLARIGAQDLARLTTDVLPSFKISALGYLPAFSNWLQGSGFDLHPPTLGTYTFAGVFELVGVQEREAGLLTDFVTLPSGVTTNVYSVFRLLIHDCTAPGALVALALLGGIGAQAYQNVSEGRNGLLPLLVAVYATVIFSPISSLWAYNSPIAAVIVFAAGMALA